METIRPQPAQEGFLASPADIAIYGGAAGGGKTWALLLEALRHIHRPDFTAVIFRRTYPEITAPGGMWQESQKLYPLLGAIPNQSECLWKFPGGCQIKFGHMQHEKDRHNWLGAQIAFIGFDQLERFSEDQFWYMLSRNRSVCGVRPYMRATANPEPGWLADFLAWWIDQDTGYPISERAGKLRWFVRVDNRILWADAPGDLQAVAPGIPPKSVTFVPARLQDNQALLRADPGYLANLLALPHIEQQRLLAGNWKISSEGGEWPASYFSSDIWFDEWPASKHIRLKVMSLDPSKGKDAKHGDYSAYVILMVADDGRLYVDADLARRPTPRIVADGIELYRHHQPHGIAVEVNQFQELLADELHRAALLEGINLPIFPIENMVNKQVRIRRLGAYLARKAIRFKGGSPGAKLLVQQLRDFPCGGHDDGPDALEQGIRLASQLMSGGREREGGRVV